MSALLAYVWDATRILSASLGFARALFGLTVTAAIVVFYSPIRAFLDARGLSGLPEVSPAWLAAAFATLYLLWHLLRHAIALHRGAKPSLSLRLLDPADRYETYVAVGNRLLRLYHLELRNVSSSTRASKASVSIESYRLAGDKRLVDIRSKLKVANSDTEEIDLGPKARVVFELCGVETDGPEAAQRAEPRETQTFSIVPAGSGTITVLAAAQNAPAREEHYTLYVDGRGAMTIKPQSTH